MGFLRETIKGVTWVGAGRATTRIISFAKTAIIARILLPAQFGLYGITTLVLSLLEIVVETGINVFLIQGKTKIEEYVDTAWVVSIIRGFAIGALFVFGAPLVAAFFHSQEVIPLLRLMAVVPILRGFINPAIVRFQKDLAFNKYFAINATIFAFDAVVAVTLLVLTKNVSSLIWGNIASAALEMVLSFYLVKPTPKFIVKLDKLKQILSQGKWVTASGIFQYVFRHGDDAIVGRLLSTGPLGIYQAAYKISSLPISEVTDVVGQVTLPVYSKMTQSIEAIRKAYFKTLSATTAIVVPAGIAIYFLADVIVNVVLGPNWLAAIPVLRILTIFGVIQALVNTVYSLFFALKKQQYVTAVTFTEMVGLAIVVVPLVSTYGIEGAAYSAIIGSVATIPVAGYLLVKTFREYRSE